MPAFVISLDFELFWGVAESRSVAGYRSNIEGEWEAIPKMLDLFQRYGISVTWATVGMLMCRDYLQWREIRPSVLPSYVRKRCSTYSLDSVVREKPKLFFARPLVEQIIETPGQELASHTYSHFYCGEAGATPEQFAADVVCQQEIFLEYGIKATSLVLPRNQVKAEYLTIAAGSGITAYRGNQDHWLYRDGHFVPFGTVGRVVRKFDAYFPLSGNHVGHLQNSLPEGELLNIPASCFFRPATNFAFLDSLHIWRVKRGMLEAARADGIFHLWWHPHNFGIRLGQNLESLESLLQFYIFLSDKFGMRSVAMSDAVDARRIKPMPIGV